MICPNCGKDNKDSARFCMSCGAVLEVKTSENVQPEENKADKVAAPKAAPKKKKSKKKIIIPIIIILVIALIVIGLVAALGVGGALLFFLPQGGNTEIIGNDTEEYISTPDTEVIEPVPEEDAEPALSRVNYYDSEGNILFYELYTYYENGLLCNMTMYKSEEAYDGTYYQYSLYSDLYLYDSEGNLTEVITDSSSHMDSDGSIVVDYVYGDDGHEDITFDPKTESIAYAGVGIDPDATEEIYEDADTLYLGDSQWAKEYIDSIVSDITPTDASVCRFIYIDDDDLPELWVDHSYGAAGAYVYALNNGSADAVYISHGMAYWHEKQNLLYTSGGHMGYYDDAIYRLEKGKFIPVATGSYGEVWDGEDNISYEFFWNNAKTTEENYNQKLEAAFDMSKASEKDRCVFTYTQFKLLLNSIAYPDGHNTLDEPAIEAYTAAVNSFGWGYDSYNMPMYALYDIDEDGIPELILKSGDSYYFYSYKNRKCDRVGYLELSGYEPLYKFDGNGIVILDSGSDLITLTHYRMGDDGLQEWDTVLTTEWDSYEELEQTLEGYERVYDFYPTKIPISLID